MMQSELFDARFCTRQARSRNLPSWCRCRYVSRTDLDNHCTKLRMVRGRLAEPRTWLDHMRIYKNWTGIL